MTRRGAPGLEAAPVQVFQNGAQRIERQIVLPRARQVFGEGVLRKHDIGGIGGADIPKTVTHEYRLAAPERAEVLSLAVGAALACRIAPRKLGFHVIVEEPQFVGTDANVSN